jgi:hypothetical protein
VGVYKQVYKQDYKQGQISLQKWKPARLWITPMLMIEVRAYRREYNANPYPEERAARCAAVDRIPPNQLYRQRFTAQLSKNVIHQGLAKLVL